MVSGFEAMRHFYAARLGMLSQKSWNAMVKYKAVFIYQELRSLRNGD